MHRRDRLRLLAITAVATTLVTTAAASGAIGADSIADAKAAVRERVSHNGPAAGQRTTSQEPAARTQADGPGEAVEILDARTETTKTFVDPAGTTTVVQHSGPRHVQRDGAWVDVDLRLQQEAGGRIVPAAAAVDLSFSGGGSEPLVVIGRDGVRLEVRWPTRLPTPTIDGDTVTYPEVLRGVDLQVRAEAESFTYVLVVKDARAAVNRALAELVLTTQVTAGTLQASDDGGFVVVDENGAQVLTSRPGLVWDSSGRSRSKGPVTKGNGDQAATAAAHLTPAEGDRVESVGVRLDAGTVRVTPSKKLLTGSDTVFPVYIDSTVGAWRRTWAMVDAVHPSRTATNWTGTEGVGYIRGGAEGRHTQRLYWGFDTASAQGKTITSATFSAYQTHQFSCHPSPVDLYLTKGFSQAFDWNGQPEPITHVGSQTTALGRAGCTPGGGAVEFDATAAAQLAADSGSPQVGMMLRAPAENTNTSWKRFRPDATLSITYSTPAAAPTMLSIVDPPAACATGADRPAIGDSTPMLRAWVDREDGQHSSTEFEIWGGDQLVDGLASGPLTGPAWHTAQVGNPLPDATYRWRVRSGEVAQPSPWSVWCEFTIDTVKPSAPGVSSTAFPPGGTGGYVGEPGDFTFTSGDPDVVRYGWSLTSEPTATVDVAPGASATVEVTPDRAGPTTLRAWSFDSAGNRSLATTYDFRVRSVPVSAWWKLDEPEGTQLEDSSGSATAATATGTTPTGGVWSEWAGDETDRARQFDGVDDYVQGPVAALRTDRSFSVAAWVKADDVSSPARTVLAQGGEDVAGFTLGLGGTDGRWAFSLAGQDDATDPQWARAESNGPAQSGEWVHLVGTYNATTKTASLWVNGELQRTQATVAGGFHAPGHLWFGTATGGVDGAGDSSQWAGVIDDVRLFPGLLDESAVFRIANEMHVP